MRRRQRRAVAFDLGLRTGYAQVGEDSPPRWASWDLRGSRFEGGGMRFVRLRAWLVELLEGFAPEIVGYEEVRAHRGVHAAHAYGGMLAVVTEECERRGIPYAGVAVGAVKRHATGRGNAGKAEVVEAMRRRVRVAWDPYAGSAEADGLDSRVARMTSDEADALAVLDYLVGL